MIFTSKQQPQFCGMNLFLNKKSILTVAILIVVGAVLFMMLPQSNLPRSLFGHYDDNCYPSLQVFGSENPNSDKYYSFQSVSNIPSYKKGKNTQYEEPSTREIDFKAASFSTSGASKRKQLVVKNAFENSPTSYINYNYRQPQTASKSANIHAISSAKVTFQTSNTAYHVSNNLQSEGVYGATNSRTSNPGSNSFLANNTLSLTTDLTENNSPMLIDGNSNPGEVGVPVGDGVWVLLGLLVGYSLVFIKKFD